MRRPRIGATIAEVPPARMAQLKASCPGFPDAVSCGLVVTGVARGSAAEAAGLREEDVIVEWQGGGTTPQVPQRGEVQGQALQGGPQGQGRLQGQGQDLIALFASALKRHLDGPALALSVVRQAADGGYEFVRLSIKPEEATEC